MNNSKARSNSSTFFPPLQPSNHRIFSKKVKFIRDRKIDPVETLPHMIDKISIGESIKRNVPSNLIREAAAREDIVERDLKGKMTFLHDIGEISSKEMCAALRKITENPREPFSFLANIFNEFLDDDQSSMETEKSTEIDIQLAAAAKRIESSKILLDETKSYIEDIRLRAKQSIFPQSETNDYKDYDDKKGKIDKEE